MAHDLGGPGLVELIVDATVTCYNGDMATRHDWGGGCGQCPACGLRRKGWEEWRSGTT